MLFPSFPFASPSSAFRVGEACRRAAAEEESILMVSGSLATANSIGGEFDLGAGDPSDSAKTTFPSFLLQSPQFAEQTDHTVGNANELGFSLSQRVTARSEQHLSAFCVFRSFAKIDLATAVQCQLGAGKGGTTDLARVLLGLTANSPRHLNYSNVSPLFIADCQATTSGKETDNRRSSAAFEIGIVDWRTAADDTQQVSGMGDLK